MSHFLCACIQYMQKSEPEIMVGHQIFSYRFSKFLTKIRFCSDIQYNCVCSKEHVHIECIRNIESYISSIVIFWRGVVLPQVVSINSPEGGGIRYTLHFFIRKWSSNKFPCIVVMSGHISNDWDLFRHLSRQLWIVLSGYCIWALQCLTLKVCSNMCCCNLITLVVCQLPWWMQLLEFTKHMLQWL